MNPDPKQGWILLAGFALAAIGLSYEPRQGGPTQPPVQQSLPTRTPVIGTADPTKNTPSGRRITWEEGTPPPWLPVFTPGAAVRVAQEENATLCDAAAAFATLAPPLDPYFQTDGIHLSKTGDQLLAALLAGCIVKATDG